MNATLLHYIHDPLCGWCYAAAPLVDAAANEGFELALHGGALWERETAVSMEKRQYIRQSDRRISALTGQTFGAGYLKRLLWDNDLNLWSRPCLAAILAAGLQRRAADLEMLHAIQRAHYLEGLRVLEPEVLLEFARQLGLDSDCFAQALLSNDVDTHIRESRRWMTRFGIYGFPGFVLEQNGNFFHVNHEPFYAKPQAFVQELRQAMTLIHKVETRLIHKRQSAHD